MTFDWATPFGIFLDSLRDLRAHLVEHDFYVGVEQDAEDMKRTIHLGQQIRDSHGWEMEVWDEFWNLIRDHMLDWWD